MINLTKSLTWPPTRFIGCDVGKSAIAVFDAGSNGDFAVPNERDALDASLPGSTQPALSYVKPPAAMKPGFSTRSFAPAVPFIAPMPAGQSLHPFARHTRQKRCDRRPRSRPLRTGTA